MTTTAFSGNGTSGADFLNIPVGAEPAALGGAYSALASNMYAPVWNPAGLGRVQSTEFGGQHLSYIESVHYEYAGIVHPIKPGRSIGASVQYLGSGEVVGRDPSGNPTGNFSNDYAAYSLAYGHAVNSKTSVGLTSKWIRSRLGDYSANAFAFDIGSLYSPTPKIHLAAVLSQLGNKLKFIHDSNDLPQTLRLGAGWQAGKRLTLGVEGTVPREGTPGAHVGIEWSPLDLLALRAGYRTDTKKELSAVSGLSAGLGVRFWGSELAYAWVPSGDLGNSHYISLRFKLGTPSSTRENLIRYETQKSLVRAVPATDDPEWYSLNSLLEQQPSQKAEPLP